MQTKQPKVGDMVWFGYQEESYEPRLAPHPAIVVQVRESGDAAAHLGLVVFSGNRDPNSSTSRWVADVPHSPTLEAGKWSWPCE